MIKSLITNPELTRTHTYSYNRTLTVASILTGTLYNAHCDIHSNTLAGHTTRHHSQTDIAWTHTRVLLLITLLPCFYASCSLVAISNQTASISQAGMNYPFCLERLGKTKPEIP